MSGYNLTCRLSNHCLLKSLLKRAVLELQKKKVCESLHMALTDHPQYVKYQIFSWPQTDVAGPPIKTKNRLQHTQNEWDFIPCSGHQPFNINYQLSFTIKTVLVFGVEILWLWLLNVGYRK